MAVTTSTADEAIARYGVLDDPGGRDLEALARLAAVVCEVPNAAVNLITADHQHQVATTGIDAAVCARDDAMCAVVLDDPGTVVSSDASADPRFATNPFVSGVLGTVRFYASVPLTTPNHTTIGRLCVFDDEPHELAPERAEVLHMLAALVVDVLELRLRSRQLEQSLADLTRAQRELRRSNELLSLFAAQVSHDLRSPLTAVLANAELLAGEPAVAGDAHTSELVAATVAAGTRMAAMIEKMLAYARVGADLERVEVDLETVVDHVLADLAPVTEARGARVRRTALPRVRADEGQVYAVLLNLLSNAVKFTPTDRVPEITVASTRDDGGWRVTVTDNGVGIPPESRETVFDLHARGGHAVAGSGIGLATARRAVEAHGGRIGIADGPGGGTTVWFTLPD